MHNKQRRPVLRGTGRLFLLYFLYPQELAGFLEGYIDVGTDVVGVHLVIEMSLLQLAVHLGRYTREDDVNALLVVHLDEVGKVVNTR